MPGGALKLAVIGAGVMGRNHLRAAGAANVPVAGVFDLDRERARAANAEFGCAILDNLDGINAAIVAVPTGAHTSTALPLLQKGIPCLVEKPFAATEADCRLMIEAAAITGAVLQIGHIERFNPAVEALAAQKLEPAAITHLSARRAGPASARVTDISVVLDLMVHDLDIVLALKRQPVTGVEVTGSRDHCVATLAFADASVASLLASRVATTRIRDLEAETAGGTYHLDYIAKSLTQDGNKIDVFASDALGAQMRDFIACIQKKRSPRVTGETAFEVLKLAWRIEAALEGTAS